MQQRDLVQAQIERLHAHMEQQQGASAAAHSSAPAAAAPSLNGFNTRGGVSSQELVPPATLAAPATSTDTAAPRAPDQSAAAVRLSCYCLVGVAMLVGLLIDFELWDGLQIPLLSLT